MPCCFGKSCHPYLKTFFTLPIGKTYFSEVEKTNLKIISQKNILAWGSQFSRFCFLNSNGFTSQKPFIINSYDFLAAAGCDAEITANANSFSQLASFLNEHTGKWIFGFLSYDLKNEVENLSSEHKDNIALPLLHFFVPEIVLIQQNGEWKIAAGTNNKKTEEEIWNEIISSQERSYKKSDPVSLQQRVTKEKYIETFQKLKNHIQLGDIYEITFCQEFFTEQITVDPFSLYSRLNEISPSPMSCFYKYNDKYLISSSPERFLKKEGDTLISQPIKGTIRRGTTKDEDDQLKQKLVHDEKERSENVMIVDLVRNDLSRIAKRASVGVDELFGIYSFPQVHQMISTVSCKLKPEIKFVDILQATFPMGSMTGAPKIRAMELIEKYEAVRRGLFSGSVGYISPDGDFDYNVIIRSILYNESNKYLSIMAGGAITAGANAEDEYSECLLKAHALMKALAN